MSHALIESLVTEVVVIDAAPAAAVFTVAPLGVRDAMEVALADQAAAVTRTLFGRESGLSDGIYTFTTMSDDGVRLWVNGQQIVSNWANHALTSNSGTISLSAGIKYDIKLEFFENRGLATVTLSWAYPGQARQIIPQRVLFPTVPANRPPTSGPTRARCSATAPPTATRRPAGSSCTSRASPTSAAVSTAG